MGLMPQSLVGKIQFSESHLPTWVLNSVAIGSSAGEITAIQTKTTAARAAFTAQQEAQHAAQVATAALRQAVNEMADRISDLVKKVRARAATDGDNIYNLAGIPAPATPTPVGAPGTPYKIEVTLQPDGSLKFTWKCDNPTGSQGTIYNVYRAPTGSEDFEYLGGSGRKEFVDFSLPSGLASVTYKIQALRSTVAGVANEFAVKFGVSSTGSMTAMIDDDGGGTKPTKIAA